MDFFTYLWQLDSSLLLWFQSIRQEWMTPFWKFVTSLGDAGWFWIALALFLLCFRSTRRAGLAAFIALAIGALIGSYFGPRIMRHIPVKVIRLGIAVLALIQAAYFAYTAYR